MSSKITYDLQAKISMFPTEMGGRKSPVATGYRPAFSFGSSEHFSGVIRLLKSKELKPGDTGKVIIKLLPARHLRHNLKPNDSFTLTEGSKTVGSGIIEKVMKAIVQD